MMQSYAVGKFFQPEQKEYEQMSSEERDIYGLGKSIQYLLAFSEVEPAFSRKEENRLKRMIEKCTDMNEKRRFHKVEEVQKYLADFYIK